MPPYEWLKKLKVAELKEQLAMRGLSQTGQKDELIARLSAADAAAGQAFAQLSTGYLQRSAIEADDCPAWKSTRPADAAAVHKTIEYIANECINNNWYRKDDGSDDEAHYLYLTDRHWETILAEFFSKPGVTLELEGGYGFLDDEGGTAGMICLSFAGLCNPKWTFRVNAQGKIAYTTVSG